uniref:Uncharacterized protein n=1 Tax=uncultured marine virus TaxID=186617 RepID=A0A0F7L4L4_9VIRU|nr:hypothetical protein [uncultured marine virus]
MRTMTMLLSLSFAVSGFHGGLKTLPLTCLGRSRPIPMFRLVRLLLILIFRLKVLAS